jgi:predicted DNA-binding antitoxin AbrB/MazE fold protein
VIERTIEAIYENGVLRPVEPLDWLGEQRRVTVTVHAQPAERPLDGWVGGMSDEDADEMRAIIAGEFGRVNPDDWK